MARYIDAIALQRRICGARCGCECEDCGNEGDCTFEQFITFAPTADVAPRAEVAREIFEEINAIKKEYASGDIDGNELYIRLYQLEKKYTEG